MAMQSVGRALVSVGALGFLVAATVPAQMPFQNSLVATAVGGRHIFLQSIAMHWAPSSIEHRYRVERAAAPAGPWVVDQEVEALSATVRRLPPGVPVYLRVAALHQVGPEKWQATETTNATVTATPASSLRDGSPPSQTFGLVRCTQPSPSNILLSWHAVPDAAHYRITPRLRSSTGTMINLATIAARDTTLTIASLPVGSYRMTIEPEFDVANWPSANQTAILFGTSVFDFDLIPSVGQVVCTP